MNSWKLNLLLFTSHLSYVFIHSFQVRLSCYQKLIWNHVNLDENNTCRSRVGATDPVSRSTKSPPSEPDTFLNSVTSLCYLATTPESLPMNRNPRGSSDRTETPTATFSTGSNHSVEPFTSDAVPCHPKNTVLNINTAARPSTTPTAPRRIGQFSLAWFQTTSIWALVTRSRSLLALLS